MMDKKSHLSFHYETLNLLNRANVGNEGINKQILSICDTLAHTAPEILDKKAWNSIYTLCTNNFIDLTNEVHANCFQIYTERIELYKTL